MKTIKDKDTLNRLCASSYYRKIFSNDMNELTELFLCRPGDIVIEQNNRSSYLFYLPYGRLKVSYLTANAKTIIVNQLKGPCLIGEMELFNEKESFTVEALEECLLVGFPLATCEKLLKEDVRFLQHVCVELSVKERNNVRRLLHSLSYPLKNRLARFILDYSENDCFRIKKVTVAESLGVSYRHLESVMSSFVEDKVLAKEKLVYRILNKKELERLSAELRDPLF